MRDQGAALQRRAQPGRHAAARAAALVTQPGVEYLVIAARGSSYNAARFGQYLFGREAGLAVALAAPSLFSPSGQPPSLRGAAVLGISQSGRSPDVVGVLSAARSQGRPTIALTNDDASPLAQEADITIPLGTGAEESVAATKTYLGSLHALVQLVDALRPDAERESFLDQTPAEVARLVHAQLESRNRFDDMAAARGLTVVGRGLANAAAHETALKIRELAGLATEAFSPPDLLHGPIAALHGDGWLWLVSTPGAEPAPEYADLLAKLGPRAGRTVAVTQDPQLVATAELGLQLPEQLPGWFASMLAAIPAQAAALRLAELRGVDVDHPHGLTKVTLTR